MLMIMSFASLWNWKLRTNSDQNRNVTVLLEMAREASVGSRRADAEGESQTQVRKKFKKAVPALNSNYTFCQRF